jgi:hypothetical protein
MHPNSFEEHRSDDAPTAAPTPLTLPPNTFTNVAPTPTDRPSTSSSSTPSTRQPPRRSMCVSRCSTISRPCLPARAWPSSD